MEVPRPSESPVVVHAFTGAACAPRRLAALRDGGDRPSEREAAVSQESGRRSASSFAAARGRTDARDADDRGIAGVTVELSRPGIAGGCMT